MKKRGRKITHKERILLLIIIFLVFFLPDFYILIRQKYFSQDLKIYKLADIKYNLITQTYEETSKSSDTQQEEITLTQEEEQLSQTQERLQEQGQAQAQLQNSSQEPLQAQTQSQQKSEDLTKEYGQESGETQVLQLVENKPLQEQVFISNSQISIISEEKLSAYSKTGEKKWEAVIYAPEPYIVNSKEYIYIINKQKGDIAKLNANNEIVAVVQNLGKITQMKASDEHFVFNGSNPNEFTVLDQDLQFYSQFVIPNADVVGFELSQDSKNVIVSTLHINKYKLESFVLTYDIKGKIIGTADINQQIVYSMNLEQNMIVVTDSNLISYDKSGLKSAQIPNSSSLIDLCVQRDKVYTLSVDEEDKNLTGIHVFSQYLDKLAKVNLKEPKEGIIANDKFCLAYDYSTLELYDNRLNYISQHEIKENIDEIKWIDDYHFAIIGDGIVNIYEIR